MKNIHGLQTQITKSSATAVAVTVRAACRAEAGRRRVHAATPDAAGILGFYMGKNTPERTDYIMENLVVPVED